MRHGFEASRYEVSLTLGGRMVFRELCKAESATVGAPENFDPKISCHGQVYAAKALSFPITRSRDGMDAKCSICLGIGWVCENHPDRPWDDELGCTCGAGEPCKCNAVGEPGVDEPDISQVIEEGNKTRH